jgi:chromate transporter
MQTRLPGVSRRPDFHYPPPNGEKERLSGQTVRPSAFALARAFLIVGATSFGGGLTGHLRRSLVEERRWLTEGEFLEGLSVAQAVPGPNAINLAIYSGWRLHGPGGAVVAALAVMLVPLAFVSALAAGWGGWSASPRSTGVLRALGAFGVGLMASSGLTMLRAARFDAGDLALAAVAFLAVAVIGAPVPAVLFGLAAVSSLRRRGGETT